MSDKLRIEEMKKGDVIVVRENFHDLAPVGEVCDVTKVHNDHGYIFLLPRTEKYSNGGSGWVAYLSDLDFFTKYQVPSTLISKINPELEEINIQIYDIEHGKLQATGPDYRALIAKREDIKRKENFEARKRFLRGD